MTLEELKREFSKASQKGDKERLQELKREIEKKQKERGW
jgi:hypothetical protein